jgi:O-antigen/teichoic acid export membrane protein
VRPNQQGAPQSIGGRKLHPFFRDVGITVLGQVAFAVLNVLLYRLLAQRTGTDGFASYTLTKQATVLLFPVITVGLIAGLPRYLALPARDDGPTSDAYLLAAITICGSAAALAAVAALAFPAATAELFFGSSERDELVVAFVALLVATAVFHMAYGYYRGLLRIRTASALQIGALALPPPLIVLAFSDEGIDTIILLAAIALAGVSLLAIAPALVRGIRTMRRRRLRAAARDLWHYGPRRVPGDLANMGLFVLVPILTAHVGTLTDVAYLGAGQQVLSMLSVAVLPLGLVLLPSLTRLWASDRERAGGYVGDLVALSAHVAIFVSLQAVIFADIAVRGWLGSGFDGAGTVVRIAVLPAGVFVLHLMLRSTLDAVEVRSYNSRNNFIALGVLALAASVLLALDVASPVVSVAWAFAAGVIAQGVMTFLTVQRMFGLSMERYALGLALPLGIATGLVGLLARPLVDGAPAELLALGALELALAAVYFGTLVWAGTGWVTLLRERVFERS